MLSQNQTKWVLFNLQKFLIRNLGDLPVTVGDWQRVMDEAKGIAAAARDNADCMELIGLTLQYLEDLTKLQVLSLGEKEIAQE